MTDGANSSKVVTAVTVTVVVVTVVVVVVVVVTAVAVVVVVATLQGVPKNLGCCEDIFSWEPAL